MASSKRSAFHRANHDSHKVMRNTPLRVSYRSRPAEGLSWIKTEATVEYKGGHSYGRFSLKLLTSAPELSFIHSAWDSEDVSRKSSRSELFHDSNSNHGVQNFRSTGRTQAAAVAGSWHDQLVVCPQHPLRPPQPLRRAASGATSAATSFSSMLTLSIAHRPFISLTVPSYDSYCASACLFGRTRQRGEKAASVFWRATRSCHSAFPCVGIEAIYNSPLLHS